MESASKRPLTGSSRSATSGILPTFFKHQAHDSKRSDDDASTHSTFSGKIPHLFLGFLDGLMSKYLFSPVKLVTLGILLFIFLFYFGTSLSPSHLDPRDLTSPRAKSWGEAVARGDLREETVGRTPQDFNGLEPRPGSRSDGKWFEGKAEEGGRFGEKEAKLVVDDDFNRNRHGIYGGENPDWETGVVGVGRKLGKVDMRKDGVESTTEGLSDRKEKSVQHHLQNAWEYLDAKDEEDTKKRMGEAAGDKVKFDKLPLRDKVREDEEGRKEAAKFWSDVYGAYEGVKGKSALEIQVEKLVRREKVVVFSKSYCPHSARAKTLLKSFNMSPEPFIVEVDLRPDAANVKALLTRLTSHSTFPNVIVGGKSLGGADDVTRLHSEGKLKQILRDAGVSL